MHLLLPLLAAQNQGPDTHRGDHDYAAEDKEAAQGIKKKFS